jgi:hypothetical protein
VRGDALTQAERERDEQAARAGRAEKKYLTFMYNIAQRIFADHDTRAGAFGTMLQEHLHALLRRGCYGDARLSTLDFAMQSVIVQQQLRAMAGIEAAFGTCNKREQTSEVQFRARSEGEEAPLLGQVMRRVAASLRRTQIFLPDAVVGRLALQGVDVRNLSEFDPPESGERLPTFLHEVIGWDRLIAARGLRASVTTGEERITATGGLGGVKRQKAAGVRRSTRMAARPA